MIRIDAEKYLLELTFKCVDREDGNNWWDYDVYLFDKANNKVKYSTKDNIFHDPVYNHMELAFDYDIYNFYSKLKEILKNSKKAQSFESCEQEIGFDYYPSNLITYDFTFKLFKQRLLDEELSFKKTFDNKELEELAKQLKNEYDQNTIRN